MLWFNYVVQQVALLKLQQHLKRVLLLVSRIFLWYRKVIAMFHVTNFEAPDEVARNIDMMNDDIAKKLEEISLEDDQN